VGKPRIAGCKTIIILIDLDRLGAPKLLKLEIIKQEKEGGFSKALPIIDFYHSSL
jgi:hypothetical protein